MSFKKSQSYFDLNNGRPTLQQVSPQHDTASTKYYAGDSNSYSPAFSVNGTNIETETAISIIKEPRRSRSVASSSLELNGMMHREHAIANLCYSYIPLSMCMNNEEMIPLGVYNTEAHLIFKTPPEHRFRYRYDTEMSGTHGSLQGIKSHSEKSVPEVELVNYSSEALIRVSLVTCNEIGERYPHPHSLFIKEKMYQKKIYENFHDKSLTKTGHYSDPHYIRVGINGVDFVARFEGMCIISSKKENFSTSIKEKFQMRTVQQSIGPAEKNDFSKKVEEAVKQVDLDFVSLCFEAFREEHGRLVPICSPLYSQPIGNAKSANTGKLKISRINKSSGSCRGGEEIWLLVEKINKKGLVIRFFEENDGKMHWDSCIEGDDIILHHQYAIIFKTPPYRDTDISTEVKVLMRLERTSQMSQACNYSEPITFVYEPVKVKTYKCDSLYKKESIVSQTKPTLVKRPRIESSEVSAMNVHYKRKRDEQECSNMFLDEAVFADLDHILSDNGIDFAESSQFWPRFNVEDFLQFISDDFDSPLQKDGISSAIKYRRDLLQMLHLIYSKFDENEIKKLSDRINNVRLTKGRSKGECCSGDEKDIEDAVSTLLSLREKAVESSLRKKDVDDSDCGTLHEAIAQNKPDMVRKMTMSGDCIQLDDNGNTPLHLSLLLRHDICTENLLQLRHDACASINWKNKEGKTPLHIAASNGNLHHVKLLLGCGAKVNETETGSRRNVLHVAIAERRKDLAEYLMKATDVQLDAVDADGETPLSLARGSSYLEKLFSVKAEKAPKREGSRDNSHDLNLDRLYEVLNETGSWKTLAEMWNCSYLIPCAEEAENPAKCIFGCSEQVNGELELEALRNLLDAINEKKGLIALDEILARKFLFGKQ